MNEGNGRVGAPGEDITIFAPPATARGLALTPGSLVSTPARLAVPMATFEISVPWDRMVSLSRILKEFYGDEMPFLPNVSLEGLSHLSAHDVAELQAMFKPKEPT